MRIPVEFNPRRDWRCGFFHAYVGRGADVVRPVAGERLALMQQVHAADVVITLLRFEFVPHALYEAWSQRLKA